MSRYATIGLTMLMITRILSAGVYAAADPTMHQVYQAAENGRMTEAQQMVDQVLRDHPKSSKAYYLEAELEAKQERLAKGRAELARAEELSPTYLSPRPRRADAPRTAIRSKYGGRGTRSTDAFLPWSSVPLDFGVPRGWAS
jgi:ATP/maltotriose-dependent transcriptional regulator MalT